MAYKVATRSDYLELLKKMDQDEQGVSKWEKYFLNPLNEQYESGQEAISNKINYDISGAYTNYKNAQRNLMMNQRIGSGLKEEVSQNLSQAYSQQYKGLRNTESQELGKLKYSYMKQLAENEEALASQAEQLEKLERSIYDFGGITDYDALTTPVGKTTQSGTAGLGYYDFDPKTQSYTQSLRGVDFFDKILHTRDPATQQYYTDYLYEKDPELYDYYMKNKGVVNKLIAGLEEDDWSYKPNEHFTEEVKEEVVKEKPKKKGNPFKRFGTSQML